MMRMMKRRKKRKRLIILLNRKLPNNRKLKLRLKPRPKLRPSQPQNLKDSRCLNSKKKLKGNRLPSKQKN